MTIGMGGGAPVDATDWLAAIVQSSHDAIIGKSPSGQILTWNAAAEALYGWSAAEAIGRDVGLVVPDDQRDIEDELFRRVLAGEMVQAVEVRRRRKSGSALDVSLSMSPIRDRSGLLVGISSSSRDVGERLRGEAQLAAVAASSHEAIISRSPTGEILSWNGGAEELYGWTAAEAIGRDISLLVPSDQRASEDEMFSRTLAGEAMKAVERHRIDKSGHTIDVSLSMSPILEAGGRVTGVASSSREVGERRRAEASFQQILDAAPDAMVCVDERGTIIFVNGQVEEIFGYQPTELIGQSIEVLVPDGNRTGHADNRARYVRNPIPRRMGDGRQLYGLRKNGETFPCDISLAAIASPSGIITIAAARDVSERHEAEAALQESEQRFNRMMSSTDVGFFLRDPTQMLYMNPSFLRIFGADSDLPGASVPDVMAMIHPDDREQAADVTSRADRGESTQAELRIVRPDGEVRWIRATNDPVHDASGRAVQVAGTIEDVTKRKITEAALRSAQRDAERANMAKSEFLSRMSHELRTPLNAVLGFAQLLELDQLSESQATAVGHILRGGRHLLEMINDVLDISRIETDQLEITTEPVLVSEVLADTIELMQPLSNQAGVQVLFDASDPDAARFVLADKRRLRQVLLNLLSNAIKYNQRGGQVDVRCDLAGEDQVRLRVTDTGKGIRLEDQHRLFTPFDRLGEQSSDVDGTGIGLALTQRLVAIMGGHLDVESEVGVGSSFSVVLPQAPSRKAKPGDMAAREVATLSGSILLYIEDNLPNVQLVQSIVRRRPRWTMVHAGQGGHGLELIHNQHPTLILLDLNLPDMNGIDIVHALKSSPDTAAIPLVIVSADASPQQIRRLHDAGAIRYLTKPLGVVEILGLLDEHADTREPERAVQPEEAPPEAPEAPQDAPAKSAVLCVEDDADNVRLIERIMRMRPNLELLVARTGQEGLEIANEAQLRLILLDRRLPDMLGNDVVAALKSSPATDQIPIVMLSGDSGKAHIAEILQQGANEFLAKPFDLDELLRTIDRYCPVEAATPTR
jgi:PAS domain S-box-containing protein